MEPKYIEKKARRKNIYILFMSSNTYRRSFDLEENRDDKGSRIFCSPSKHERSLGIAYVSMIIFFNVCGGPWGSEQIMSAGGPLLGLIGVFVFAIFLAIPSILMTTELCTMFPTNGGYSIWVKEAFGPFWGFQESWWSWGSGVVDNAVYPVLFFDVLSQLFDVLQSLNWIQKYAIKVLIMICFAIPNFLFVNVVGRWMLVLFFISMAPFVAFVSAGLATSKSADAHELIEIKPSFSSIDWSTFLSVMYWNFSGFDCVSTISGEIKQPSRTYDHFTSRTQQFSTLNNCTGTIFRGSMLGCFMMIVVYVLCLSTAVLVNDPNWNDFEEGSFVDTAKTIETRVGSRQGWLVNWLAVASLFSFIGQFSAELMEDSFQVLGVAEHAMLPKILSWKHPRFGTHRSSALTHIIILHTFLTTLSRYPVDQHRDPDVYCRIPSYI